MRIEIPPEGIEYFLPGGIEPILAIKPHSVEGDRVTVYFGGGDIVGPRNMQMGQIGTSPGGDISAGGAGGVNDPRMPLALQYDNGSSTTIYDGRHNEIMSCRPGVTPAKNVARFKAETRFWGPTYVRTASGGWRKL